MKGLFWLINQKTLSKAKSIITSLGFLLRLSLRRPHLFEYFVVITGPASSNF